MALDLPPGERQARLLNSILGNLDNAAAKKSQFARLFQSTAEDLLRESLRWEAFPEGRDGVAKLVTKLYARRGEFAEAFKAVATIAAGDIRSEAHGEIGAAMHIAGEPVDDFLFRLPLRSRLLVAGYIGEAVVLGKRPAEARSIIGRQLQMRAAAQTNHAWGRPRLLGALAAAFSREGGKARATELFAEAAERIQRINTADSRTYSLCSLALEYASIDDLDGARAIFLLAKQRAERKLLVLTSIGAREAEAGLLADSEVTLDEVASRLSATGKQRPEKTVETYGELAAGFVRIERADKAEAALSCGLDVVRFIQTPKAQADIASKVAVQAAKAGIRSPSLFDWAKRYVQVARDICERTRGLRLAVREPSRLWRVESLLLASQGQVDEAFAKARRNRNAKQQARGLRDLADFCMAQRDFKRAFEITASMTHNPSEMVPDVARELAARGELDLSLRLVPLAIDYFDGAYRLAAYVIRYTPASLSALEKTLEWFRRSQVRVTK
jgi:tetratricopeptide (TPR) repeat protein